MLERYLIWLFAADALCLDKKILIVMILRLLLIKNESEVVAQIAYFCVQFLAANTSSPIWRVNFLPLRRSF